MSFVNHWRFAELTSPARVRAAEQVKALKDSLLAGNKNLKLIVMGDMNDDPWTKAWQLLWEPRSLQ